MGDDSLVVLEELPVPGTDTGDVLVTYLGKNLRFVFECIDVGNGGQRFNCLVEFFEVKAHRHRAESLCTAWHIGFYDTLSEVLNSSWVYGLSQDSARGGGYGDSAERLKHFGLYVDSDGCFEVAAAGYRMSKVDWRSTEDLFVMG